jgi:hypothetical protein
MSESVHDGQGDAMPCACPACASPFTSRKHHTTARPTPSGEIAEVLGDIAAAKICPAWCGDACTCGRGPESADLDPLDVEGMRAIEGRA